LLRHPIVLGLLAGITGFAIGRLLAARATFDPARVPLGGERAFERTTDPLEHPPRTTLPWGIVRGIA
jgi:hypothetical protein